MSYNKRTYLEPAAIGLALFFVYNVTLAANLAESHDSLAYLENIETSQTPWLFHAHHLLYAVLGRAFWTTWRLLGYTRGALLPLQELNIAFACMSIIVLYVLLRNNLRNRAKSLLVCSAVAFSFGFWFYSGTVEVYIIPLFFLLLSFSLSYLSFRNPSLKLFAGVGVCNALAILFHQMNILFVAVVLAAIFVNSRLASVKAKATATLTYMACLAVPVVIAYLLVIGFVLKPDTLEQAFYWFTGYLHSGHWGKVEVLSPIKALVGFSRTIIGGHFVFSITPLSELVSSLFGGKFLVSQKFLTQHLGLLQASILLAGVIPLAVAFIVALICYIHSSKSIWREHACLLPLSVVWFISYAVFVCWWEPFNLEFWIAPLIPAWIIVSLPFLSQSSPIKMLSRNALKTILTLAIGFVLFVNLFGSILPLHSTEHDYYFQRSLWYMDNAKQGDLIVCSRDWLWGQYLRRYSEAEVLGVAEVLESSKSVKDAPYDIIDRRVLQVLQAGGKVYITSDALQPETTTLESYGLDAADFTNLWTKYQPSWVRIDIADNDIAYVLKYCPPQ